MRLEWVSASRISTFLQCPMQYHAVYELDRKEEVVHPLTVMGSAIHKTMELCTRARMLDRHDSLWEPLDIAEEVFRKYKVEENLWELGCQLLSNAAEWGYFDTIRHTIGCELNCAGTLSDGTPYKGIIDRLNIRGRYANVIDLKTQKRMFTEDKLQNNWQARVYDRAVRDKYPQVSEVTVSFWVLRHRVQEVSFNSEESEQNHGLLIDMASRIRDCDSPICKPSVLCQWCSYKDECSQEAPSLKERLGWK
jgi:RecB family exonuclease